MSVAAISLLDFPLVSTITFSYVMSWIKVRRVTLDAPHGSHHQGAHAKDSYALRRAPCTVQRVSTSVLVRVVSPCIVKIAPLHIERTAIAPATRLHGLGLERQRGSISVGARCKWAKLVLASPRFEMRPILIRSHRSTITATITTMDALSSATETSCAM